MKHFLSDILIVYLLFLSVNVCSDNDLLLHTDGNTDTFITGTNIEDSHDHEDTCSPLCYCICCNSPITIEIKPVNLFSTLKSQLSFPAEIQKIDNPNKPFYHPPKV